VSDNPVRFIAHLKNDGETASKADIEIAVLWVKEVFRVVLSVGKGAGRSETILDCPSLVVCREILKTVLEPFEPFKKKIFWPTENISYLDFLTRKKELLK